MRDTEITTGAFGLIATVARISSTLGAPQSGGMTYGKSDVTYSLEVLLPILFSHLVIQKFSILGNNVTQVTHPVYS